MANRPLPRSLDPLAGEGLPGYLLRLAHRLEQAPADISIITGLTRRANAIPVGLMLQLDPDTTAQFAACCRLTPQEATGLCLTSLGARYPPLDLAPDGRVRQAQGIAGLSRWIFTQSTRYCKACLAGDGSPIQQHHGGAWKKSWRVPIVFACTIHQCLLSAYCPECQVPVHVTSSPGLLPRPYMLLHPAQCRTPVGPRRPATARGRLRACGTRLDTATATSLDLTSSDPALRLQRRLADLLRRDGPATVTSIGRQISFSDYFLDLRLITCLVRMAWPATRQLVDSVILATAIDRHVDQQNRLIHDRRQQGRRTQALALYDSLPLDAMACAGLLTAAERLLAIPDSSSAEEHLRPLVSAVFEIAAWRAFFREAKHSCSNNLRTLIEPQMERLRPPDRRGSKSLRQSDQPRTENPRKHSWSDYHRQEGHIVITPTGDCQFDHRHIPQNMTDEWFARHFDGLAGINPINLRRAAAIWLVQMSSGGSILDAGELLQIPRSRSASVAYQTRIWIRETANKAKFTAAVDDFAAELNNALNPVDYGRRRDMLTTWTIPVTDWNELINGLGKHSYGQHFRETGPDRKRRAASVLVWESVTRGDSRIAPLVRAEERKISGSNLLMLDVHRLRTCRRRHPDGPTTDLINQLRSYAQKLATAIDHGEPI